MDGVGILEPLLGLDTMAGGNWGGISLTETGDPGSSSLIAACSMVDNRPLFFGLKFSTGIAGGGDFLSTFLGLSRVEVAEAVGKVVFSRALGDMTGRPMV